MSWNEWNVATNECSSFFERQRQRVHDGALPGVHGFLGPSANPLASRYREVHLFGSAGAASRRLTIARAHRTPTEQRVIALRSQTGWSEKCVRWRRKNSTVGCEPSIAF